MEFVLRRIDFDPSETPLTCAPRAAHLVGKRIGNVAPGGSSRPRDIADSYVDRRRALPRQRLKPRMQACPVASSSRRRDRASSVASELASNLLKAGHSDTSSRREAEAGPPCHKPRSGDSSSNRRTQASIRRIQFGRDRSILARRNQNLSKAAKPEILQRSFDLTEQACL